MLSRLCTLALLAAATTAFADMKKGTPPLTAAGALAFGPDGVLFVADSPAATVYAIDTGDAKKAAGKPADIANVGDAVGGLLGTTADEILINDMKVNPASGTVYLSVSRGKGKDGKPALVKIVDGKPAEVPLKDVMYSSVKLENAGKNNAVTSMAYLKGDLYVAGMTTEAWASNLKAIPFPFSEAGGKGAGVEIYHGAHGAFETKSPIQTFMAYDIAGQTHLLASYTCTPLVKFPVAEVKKGDKVKGTTVAELGNRNRPLDIIAYTKDGKDYALIANSARGVMKVALDNVEKVDGITTRVNGTAGLSYETIKEMEGVLHLDKSGDDSVVVLKKAGTGVSLATVKLP